MTVPVSDRLSPLYVGDGVNTRFDFEFRAFPQEDSTGVSVRVKNGAEFETLDPAKYLVTLNNGTNGGRIDFSDPPDAATFFYVAGNTIVDQLLDITNYDNFYPDAIERAFDKITAILQEWYSKLDQETLSRILADINYDQISQKRDDDLKSYIDAINRYIESIVRSIAEKGSFSPYEINPIMFGATTNLFVDSTEAIRLAHNIANNLNLPVSYAGLTTASIKANAKIIINTDVDFCGFTPNLLNKTHPESELIWDAIFDELYIIEDNLCKYESVALTINPDNFFINSKEFLDLDAAYALLRFNSFLLPNRQDNGTRPLIIPFNFIKGVSNMPLPVDLKNYTENLQVSIRRDSGRGRIKIVNLNLNLKDVNKFTALKIQRNLVDVSNVTWFGNEVNVRTVSALIYINNCSCVSIKGLYGPGMGTDATISSYVFYASGASDIVLEDMKSSKGWDQTVTHFVNGFTVKDSWISRIDGHEGLFNVTAENIRIQRSIQYGSGGGNWSINNVELQCELSTVNLLIPRLDYGSTFLGEISITNARIKCRQTDWVGLVNFSNIGAASAPCYFPKSIYISNVVISVEGQQIPSIDGQERIRLLQITKGVGKTAYLSSKITIRDVVINAIENDRCRIRLNTAAFNKINEDTCVIEVSNITSKRKLILKIDGDITSVGVSNFPKTIFSLSGVDKKNIDTTLFSRDPSIASYTFNEVKIISAVVNTTTYTAEFSVKNCYIDYTNTVSKVFGANNIPSNMRIYNIESSIIFGDPDLSNFNSFHANKVRGFDLNGVVITTVPTLPAGVTINDLFFGYKIVGTYK